MKTKRDIKPAVSHLFRFCLLAAVLLLPLIFVNTPGATNRGQTILISVPDSNPAVFLDEDQQNPYVISLPDKGIWFVVWEDWRNWNTTGSDIYGRFINADGSFCGTEVLISNSPGNQTVPRTAYRNGGPHSPSTDRLMVIWQDTRGNETGGYVYYKVLDLTNMGGTCNVNAAASAETPTGYHQVFSETLRSRYLPKVSYDEDRDLFWIVWVEGRSSNQHCRAKPFYSLGFNFTYNWRFGDTTSMAFLRVDGGTLAVDNLSFGTNPDIMRSDSIFSSVSLSGNLTLRKYARTITKLDNNSEIELDDIAAVNGIESFIPSPVDIKIDNAVVVEENTVINVANPETFEVVIGNNTFTTNTVNIDGTLTIDFPDDTGILELDPFVSVEEVKDEPPPEDPMDENTADDIIKISEEGSVTLRKGPDLSLTIKGPVNFKRKNNIITLDLGIDATGSDDDGSITVVMKEPITIDDNDNILINSSATVDFDFGDASARYEGDSTLTIRGDDINTINGAPLSPGNHDINITLGDLVIDSGDQLTLKSGTYTVRRIANSSSISGSIYTVTEVFEFFTRVNNINAASDASSPETLITWEGIRQEATIVSTYDMEENVFGTVLTTEPKPENGQNNIFAMFDKSIKLPSIEAMYVDFGSELGSYYSSVEADPIHRKFLVTWEDHRDSFNSKIYGQLIYTGGDLYKSNFIISFQDTDGDGNNDNDVLASEQTRPHVSYDTANQRFFVTWQDGRNSTMSLENLDIYGQYVESEATSRGNNFAITSAPANQLNPITSFNNSNHMFLTVWKDARNINDTNSDIFGLPFTLDFGVPLDITPTSVDFAKVLANTTQSQTVEFTNGTISDVTIVSLETGSELFEVSGIAPGTTVSPGSTVTAQVTFIPLNKGSYEDNFTVTLGPEVFILKIPLTGTAVLEGEGVDIPEPAVTETTTADSSHPLSIGVETEETGRFYILRLHDPLDNNVISALQPDGSWVAFPDGSEDGWQNLYYAAGSLQTESIDLGTMDLRGRAGALYTASYLKDPGDEPGPFDFTDGLIQLKTLIIRNSPGGTWIVRDTVVDSRGNPVVKEHPDPLVIQDNVDTVTASWGSYNPTIEYLAGIGYNVVFSANGAVFTYNLQSFSENSFTGTMQWAIGAEKSPVYRVDGTRAGF